MADAVERWLARIDPAQHFASAVTLAELHLGVALTVDLMKRARLAQWVEAAVRPWFAGRVLEVEEAILLEWLRLIREGRSTGYTYPPADGLLAATARTHGLGVVTRNTADFAHASVPLLNPWQAA